MTATNIAPTAANDVPNNPSNSPRRLSPAKTTWRLRLVGPLLLVLLWQSASTFGLIDPVTLPSPEVVLQTFLTMLDDGRLMPSLLVSGARSGVALVGGTIAGVALALLSGLTRWGEAIIDGPIQIKRAVPTLAMIPLFIIWLGIGETTKVTILLISVMLPIYINTHAGLRGLDQRYIELAEILRLSRSDFIFRVALPAALPSFFTGLRLAVTQSFTSLVVVEQINADSGIGYLMTRARANGQTDIILMGLVIYALFGLVVDGLVRWIERVCLSWRSTLETR